MSSIFSLFYLIFSKKFQQKQRKIRGIFSSFCRGSVRYFFYHRILRKIATVSAVFRVCSTFSHAFFGGGLQICRWLHRIFSKIYLDLSFGKEQSKAAAENEAAQAASFGRYDYII